MSRYQPRKALERINVAEHGQSVHGMPHSEPFALHGRAAYPLAMHAAGAKRQPLHDAGGKQVAGRFAGHQADTRAHPRAIPRVDASRKSTRTCKASCAAGWATCKSRIVPTIGRASVKEEVCQYV